MNKILKFRLDMIKKTYVRDFPSKNIGGAIVAKQQNPIWNCAVKQNKQDFLNKSGTETKSRKVLTM